MCDLPQNLRYRRYPVNLIRYEQHFCLANPK